MGKSISQFISFSVLLGAPVVFGVFGKPAEAGVCVVAGAIGLAFINIDKIKRFKGGGFEAEMRDQLDAMVAKEAEPEEETSFSGLQVQAFGFDDNTKKVVLALNSPRYTWRSVGGIAQESGLSRQDVKDCLGWLQENELAMQVGVNKRTNWGLTEQGRDIANSLSKSA